MVTVRSGCAGLGQNPAGRLNYPGVITVHDVIEYDCRPRVGIVHRDIKPANVLVNRTRVVLN